MQKPEFRYFLNGKKLGSKLEYLTNTMYGDFITFFDGEKVQSFSNLDFFSPEKAKNSRELNDHFKGVLESNTKSTRHKSRNGETHKEIVGDLEGINRPPNKENLVFNKYSEIHNCNWTKCGEKECNHCYPIKDDVIQNNNRGEKETMEYLKELPLGSFGRRGEKINYSVSKKENIGVKENKNKPQISLLFKQFPQALEAIAKCSEYGHEKYKETDTDYLNYQRVCGGSQTYADAGLRHRLEQGNDLESGLPHQYHIAWNALAELQLWINENKS